VCAWLESLESLFLLSVSVLVMCVGWVERVNEVLISIQRSRVVVLIAAGAPRFGAGNNDPYVFGLGCRDH
jgi:hypothetical protein